MNILVEFGKRVRQLRLKKGLTQEAFAHLAQIDRTYLPGIEKGKRNSSIRVAYKIALALDITVAELFDFDE